MTTLQPRLPFNLGLFSLLCMLAFRATPALSANKLMLADPGQSSHQQSDVKIIEREQFPIEPLEIEGLAVKNVKLALSQKFSARSLAKQTGGQEEDWIDNLEFTIKNKSDKRITYLSISLCFPLPGIPDPARGLFHHLVLGVDLRASGTAATYAQPFSLAPGESFTVNLSEKDLTLIKRHLAVVKFLPVDVSLADIERVIISIPTVGYEDGVQWERGKYTIPEKQRRSDSKVIERAKYDAEPYEISNLSVKKVEITPQEKFVPNGFTKVRRDSYEFNVKTVTASGGGQEGDWLEELKFEIKNKSGKEMTYIFIELRLPETEVNGPMMVHQTHLGINPKVSIEAEKSRAYAEMLKHEKRLALETGDSLTFTLSAQQVKAVNDFLAGRKFQLSDLNRAVLDIGYVLFADGMKWERGKYWKPNPNLPLAYELISQ